MLAIYIDATYFKQMNKRYTLHVFAKREAFRERRGSANFSGSEFQRIAADYLALYLDIIVRVTATQD